MHISSSETEKRQSKTVARRMDDYIMAIVTVDENSKPHPPI